MQFSATRLTRVLLLLLKVAAPLGAMIIIALGLPFYAGTVAFTQEINFKKLPAEKQFELLVTRVLGLVKDTNSVIVCAAAHVAQRRKYDSLIDDLALAATAADHDLDGVVQRLHVRIDLVAKRAGQKAQFFA